MGSLFAGLKDAKVTERGVFLLPGQYKVRVVKALMKQVRKGFNAFILEFKIEESNYAEQKALRTQGVTDIAQLDAIEKKLPNKPGTTASWYQSLQDIGIGFGALKGFAASVLGEDPNDPQFIDEVEGFLEEVVNGSEAEKKAAALEKRLPEGALNGSLLPLETVVIKTKPKPGAPEGTDFTIYKFGKLINESVAA